MTSGQERPLGKISYEKPSAVDLGPTAPVVGGSCVDGESYKDGNDCSKVGNSAEDACGTGYSAAFGCRSGNGDALTCGAGNDYN